MLHTVEIDLGERKITLETGKVAKQANGSVVVRSDDNVVFVSACANEEPREGISFFPLTVDYREYTYAAGRFPGGFIKREGRPSEKEILTCRLMDRPIRPLFPKGFSCETQVIAFVLSADPERDPAPLALVGEAAALAISDIPFPQVLGAVTVASLDGKLVVNPSYEEVKESKLTITVAGSEEGIVMVEAGGQEASEDEVVEAIDFAHQCCIKIIAGIRELVEKAGKPKREFTPPVINQEIYDKIEAKWREALTDAQNTEKYSKLESHHRIGELKKQAVAEFDEEQQEEAGALFNRLKERIFRDEMLKVRRRPDGRAFDEVRALGVEVGILPRTHGSALFTRGETQALAVTTLGTIRDEQIMDDLEGDNRKSFMLHYNFPPYSVGEVKRLFTGRREIGHGHLAERALQQVLPAKTDFPYTIRVVSDVLESNGSSSMATVCGSTLCLLNAGVPLSAPVAGIAMGLIKEESDYVILSDILGEEDHLGDMDFKVAGTAKGITAFQMDIKIAGIEASILSQGLDQGRTGRLHILDIMNKTIEIPRDSISDYAPKIITLQIDEDKIGMVIGPGGKMIKSITAKTEATVNIEDSGQVTIYCKEKEGAEKARAMIQSIIEDPEVGKWYTGTVKRITDFGAFIEFLPGKEGLCHISKLATEHVRSVSDVLKEGQEVKVKLFDIDRMGSITLS